MGNWKYIIILAIVVTVIVTNIAGLWDSQMIFEDEDVGPAVDTTVVEVGSRDRGLSDPRDTLSAEDGRIYARAIALTDPSLCNDFPEQIRLQCRAEATPPPSQLIDEGNSQQFLDERNKARAVALSDSSYCETIVSGQIKAACLEESS